MATQKQIEANRRNARRSTGPKTPGGKDRSARNALKQGLRSSLAVIPGESPEDYEARRALHQRSPRIPAPADEKPPERHVSSRTTNRTTEPVPSKAIPENIGEDRYYY